MCQSVSPLDVNKYILVRERTRSDAASFVVIFTDHLTSATLPTKRHHHGTLPLAPRSGILTHGAIDGPFPQPLHLAAPVHLCKYEALELGRYPADGDTPRQARRQLVAVAEELVAVEAFRVQL